jgi:hypothetical protein
LAGDAEQAVQRALQDQATAAGSLLTAQKDEAEKLAKADAAAAAAKVAADLAAKIASAKTIPELSAAAIAAADDAKALAEAAQRKSNEAITAANSAKETAKELIQPVIKNDAELYMRSSPAIDGIDVNTITTSSTRSIKAIFTEAQLTANNGALQKFITKWDEYTVKEMEKFAAVAELDTKNKAYTDVVTLKNTLNGLDLEQAKKNANTELLRIQTAAKDAADLAQEAETARLNLATIDAAARAAQEVAAATKQAIDALKTTISAPGANIDTLVGELTSKLSSDASKAEGALGAINQLALDAQDAAEKAIEAAEKAALEVPFSQGGTKPIQATDTGSDLI